MVNIEYIRFGYTIVTSVVTSVTAILVVYHKFIINQVEKKVDQKIHDKEIEFMQTQIKHNYVNLKDKVDDLSSDIKIIKECIINKN